MRKISPIPESDFPRPLKNPVSLIDKLISNHPTYWPKRGEAAALRLFQKASSRVPAYKDFLRKNKCNPKSIKTIDDFKNVPTIDKSNYLNEYPLNALCWDGNLSKTQWTIATTSGSTGDPFYFPHTSLQDWQYALVAELYLRTNFEIHEKSTLYINSFPMGAWIGGVFTYKAIDLIAHRGNYNLSIISPGIHKQEVIKAVLTLGEYYDQVIIAGYAPFVKDIIDDGKFQKVNWKKYNIKFIFSAESFTERYRDYVCHAVGIKNPCRETLNHYGTVDLGTMSYETPISIALRRECLRNEKLRTKIFSSRVRQPTLTQYIPELFYFEEKEGTLICSANSGLPLVRYDLKDTGNVYTYSEMKTKAETAESPLEELANRNAISDTLWKLPFVQVFERNDFSVSLYAFQIYPETIKRALLSKKLQKYVSGKFTMLVNDSKKLDPQLNINIELKRDVKRGSPITKLISQTITNQLILEVSEYRETYREKGAKIRPRIRLYDYENEKYFKPGIKQQWVIK